MKELIINKNTVEDILSTKLNSQFLDRLSRISKNDLLPLVYTSFDGDHLSHSELMKQFIFSKSMIPLNPESVLGTYIVTNHYDGEKYPIIEDCLKLLLLCDVFLVMTDLKTHSIKDFAQLPEGVLAEVLYWSKSKTHDVGIVDIKKYNHIDTYKVFNDSLNYLHPLQKAGLKKITNTNINNLRNTVYLLSGEKHAKHADWLRKDAYNNNKIPLSPYTIINKSSLQLAYKNDLLKQYVARAVLSTKADEIYLYGIHKDHEVELSILELDVLLELYLALKINSHIERSVMYKYFGEVGVPKYLNKDRWAITEFEKVYHS